MKQQHNPLPQQPDKKKLDKKIIDQKIREKEKLISDKKIIRK